MLSRVRPNGIRQYLLSAIGTSPTQPAIKQHGITKSSAELPFEPGDRIQVLGRPSVLVLNRGVAAQRRLAEPRHPDCVGMDKRRTALQANNARPRRASGARQPQVPGVAVPRAFKQEHGSALARQQRNHETAEVEREVIRLRNECQALLAELETRVRHTLAIPQRLGQKLRSWEEKTLGWPREHRFWAIAGGVTAGAVLLGAVLGGRVARRRARRGGIGRLVRGVLGR